MEGAVLGGTRLLVSCGGGDDGDSAIAKLFRFSVAFRLIGYSGVLIYCAFGS